MKNLTSDPFRFFAPLGAMALALLLSTTLVNGQNKQPVASVQTNSYTGQTNKDIPAEFHKYFGQRVNSWRDRERQIAKLDVDADMNQDGVLSNTDPADGGAFEATPPGLILGEGEMTRVVIRLLPYRVDFDGEVVVTLEVDGINRSVRTGEFETLEDELAGMGHIRVWRDPSKKQLVLDSRDPAKRVAEFTTSYKTYPYNLPIAVPRFVFVEGVKSSPRFTGEIRLLFTVSHRSPHEKQRVAAVAEQPVTAAKEPVPITAEEAKKLGIVSFRTSFDHLLLTVQKQPQKKEFINNNNEGAWVPPPGWKY